MTTRQVTVTNRFGIHVRPCGIVSKEMAKFPEVAFEIDHGNGFTFINGIMDLMMCGLQWDQTFTLRASGEDEEEACDVVSGLLGGQFQFDDETGGSAETASPKQPHSMDQTDIDRLPEGNQITPGTRLWYMVHKTHCCSVHGCKYGDDDCPVAAGTIKQDSLCEECPDPLQNALDTEWR